MAHMCKEKELLAGHQWLKPVILATQKAAIQEGLLFKASPRQTV
jgi:hypothetical protein